MVHNMLLIVQHMTGPCVHRFAFHLNSPQYRLMQYSAIYSFLCFAIYHILGSKWIL